MNNDFIFNEWYRDDIKKPRMAHIECNIGIFFYNLFHIIMQ